MTANDHELLGQFTRDHSQDAFTALVDRHVNLVFSAAFRQVRSPHLAEEVVQTVFTRLACHAHELRADTILSAWLYHVTRNTSVDVVRREARRQAREQIAYQMSDLNAAGNEWVQIEPLLDEAMQSLEDPDRAAILLRFFENKSLREVGEALGASEDAAQKRVSRALDRLREFFAKREVTVGASSLAALLSANAVQAAPAGLATLVTVGAVAGSATLSTSTAVIAAKTIAMTTVQKTAIAVAAAGALAVGIYQARQVSQLREQVHVLQGEQLLQQAALSNQVLTLQQERDRATNALAALSNEGSASKKGTNEVLRLRGEVGRLRQENTQIGSSSALSKVTSDPASRKMLRDQQKMAMGAVYKGFSNRLKLAPEQTEQFNDLLADYIMDNVDLVTTTLRDKLPPDEMNQLFGSADAALLRRIEGLLGAEVVGQYQDYTKNLLSSISAEQFKGMLSGTGEEKDQKARQFRQLLQEQVQAALAQAGLPEDYQTIPMLNLRNIASEQEGERSLKLLETIYQQAADRGGAFLSPEDLAKLQEFKAAAINNNRAGLALNRTLMAPISK
jgi:RNA polymerase sigma factor (sigma-70 family)